MSARAQDLPDKRDGVAVEVGGAEALSEIAPAWDALVLRAEEPSPFLGSRFLGAWWRAFGQGESRLVAVYTEDRLAGGALFEERTARVEGLPVRVLSLASNVHSSRADLLADSAHAEQVGKALAAWAEGQRWTALVVDHACAESPSLKAFAEELSRRGCPSGFLPAARPPWIDLSGGPAGVEASLKAKWRSNLRNREKRLAAMGSVRAETFRAPEPGLEPLLEECFALEAKAWKGQAGSAIVSSPRTSRFYRELALSAAEEGSLCLRVLRLGEAVIAFMLDLEKAGVEYVLKIGYEPAFSACSPGALLLKRALADACARGLSRIDLLGDDMPWKRDWTSRNRETLRFLAFSPTPAGRLLHALRFRVRPFAKEALRHLRSLW